MMDFRRGKYEFDGDNFKFRKAKISLWMVVSGLLKFVLVSVSIAIVLYMVFATVVNSDVEGELVRQNKLYSKMYNSLVEKDALLMDAVTNLQMKDDEIYQEIFHMQSPDVDPMNKLGPLFGSDTIPDTRMVLYTRNKANELLGRSEHIDSVFRSIYSGLLRGKGVIPPMCLPLRSVTYPQIGASTGEKMNPFLKTYLTHTGLDFMVSLEEPVLASAEGVVRRVVRSGKGYGNMVEIEHPGGFTTRYCHLSATSARQGARVKRGEKIGTVGMSGNSFAPHLHYEILSDGVPVDPVNYLFGSVEPMDYANILYMAVNTEQSMD